MKLELKHLAGYLPYGLNGVAQKRIVQIQGFELGTELPLIWDAVNSGFTGRCDFGFKPILRPLSDLTKEIEVNGEKFVPLTELLRLSNFTVDRMPFEEQCVYLNAYNEILFLNFNDAQKLLEWHFDLFSLIENNLAININDIK